MRMHTPFTSQDYATPVTAILRNLYEFVTKINNCFKMQNICHEKNTTPPATGFATNAHDTPLWRDTLHVKTRKQATSNDVACKNPRLRAALLRNRTLPKGSPCWHCRSFGRNPYAIRADTQYLSACYR